MELPKKKIILLLGRGTRSGLRKVVVRSVVGGRGDWNRRTWLTNMLATVPWGLVGEELVPGEK